MMAITLESLNTDIKYKLMSEEEFIRVISTHLEYRAWLKIPGGDSAEKAMHLMSKWGNERVPDMKAALKILGFSDPVVDFINKHIGKGRLISDIRDVRIGGWFFLTDLPTDSNKWHETISIKGTKDRITAVEKLVTDYLASISNKEPEKAKKKYYRCIFDYKSGPIPGEIYPGDYTWGTRRCTVEEIYNKYNSDRWEESSEAEYLAYIAQMTTLNLQASTHSQEVPPMGVVQQVMPWPDTKQEAVQFKFKSEAPTVKLGSFLATEIQIKPVKRPTIKLFKD